MAQDKPVTEKHSKLDVRNDLLSDRSAWSPYTPPVIIYYNVKLEIVYEIVVIQENLLVRFEKRDTGIVFHFLLLC